MIAAILGGLYGRLELQSKGWDADDAWTQVRNFRCSGHSRNKALRGHEGVKGAVE